MKQSNLFYPDIDYKFGNETFYFYETKISRFKDPINLYKSDKTGAIFPEDFMDRLEDRTLEIRADELEKQATDIRSKLK